MIFGVFTLIGSAGTNSTKIAVLINSSFDAPNLDFPQNIYYQQKEGVVNALRYSGIPYDVVYQKIGNESLNTYGGLIAVLGDTATITSLLTNFTETPNNKTSIVLYIRGTGATNFKRHIGITDNGYVTYKNSVLIYSDSITQYTNDTYGVLSSWASHNLSVNTSLSSQVDYIRDVNNSNVPILFRITHNNGSYIVYNSELASIAGHNAIYFNGLIKGYADNVLGNYDRIASYPYTIRSPIFIRLDDINTMDSISSIASWTKYYNLTHQVTSAAILRDFNTTSLLDLKTNWSNDVQPHGWAHEYWNTNLGSQQSNFTNISNRWISVFGVAPSGFIAPYNTINANTSKSANTTNGMKWITGTIGQSPIVQRQIAFYQDNHIYEFAGYYEASLYSSENTSQYLLRLFNQNRSGGYVMHPYSGVFSTDSNIIYNIINYINNQSGFRLTTLGEMMDYYYDSRQNVSLSKSKISLISNIKGLSIIPKGILSNQTILVSDKASIYKGELNSVLLPSLSSGSYNYSRVDNSGYPQINHTDFGLTIRDGFYNTTTNKLSDVELDAYTYPVSNTIKKTLTINRSHILFSNTSNIEIYNGNYENITINLNGIKIISPLNAFIIPSSDNVNITISTWNITGDYCKKWNESSTNASITTQHTIGDFPINTNIDIFRDGVLYRTYISNSTGYISFDYSGDYSESQFEAIVNAQDTTPPTVIGNTPLGTNVSVSTHLTVTFSEAMNQVSSQLAFSTSPPTTGSFSWNGNIMTYTPSPILSPGATYIVTIGTDAKDLAGNSIQSPYNWQFTTISAATLEERVAALELRVAALEAAIEAAIERIINP